MNIAMFTNLYLPLVGGIQRSIASFKEEFERCGHRVLVITPAVERQPLNDPTVVEVPAIQNFSGSDFSVALPIPGYLTSTLDDFAPDLVHSHHPFLLGATALRMAAGRNLPLVFTYHTMWEHYLHYAPADSPAVQTFVTRMAAEYCNMCDHVIAPCESIANILRERGVTTPVSAVPTGIDTQRFRDGDGARTRKRVGVPKNAFLAGYVGRLGPEKNLGFVADALARFCAVRPDAHALFVGEGDAEECIRETFERAGVAERLHCLGYLDQQELVDAYHALDAFLFASKSETQGLVLAEAMAAGRVVVALDATGARDVLRDGENGFLLMEEKIDAYVHAIARCARLSTAERERLRSSAVATAEELSIERCADRALKLYADVIRRQRREQAHEEDNPWQRSLRELAAEWNLWAGRAAAVGDALVGERGDQGSSSAEPDRVPQAGHGTERR